ncbi:MAG: DUF998 domain-containing protein [Desulfurococcaceae archaeon]
MFNSQRLVGIWRYTGLIAVVLAWIVIAVSIAYNPWFNLFKYALSDLGDPRRANLPWIYNTGLIATGAVASVYSFYLAYRSTSKIHTFASAQVFVAGLFLALIGVFPSGTRPHVFVSVWFFIQMWLALLATLTGMVVEQRKTHATLLGLLAVIGPTGALLVKWPSVAILEIYGIIIINIYVAVLTKTF